MELCDGHPGPAHWLAAVLFWLLETAGDEDLAQQVAERDVAASLECQVNAPLNVLVLAIDQALVEGAEVAPLDTVCEREEELLEFWVWGQQLAGRKGVCGEEVARNEVCENLPWLGLSVDGTGVASGREMTHSLFFMASLWQRSKAEVRCSSA